MQLGVRFFLMEFGVRRMEASPIVSDVLVRLASLNSLLSKLKRDEIHTVSPTGKVRASPQDDALTCANITERSVEFKAIVSHTTSASYNNVLARGAINVSSYVRRLHARLCLYLLSVHQGSDYTVTTAAI